MKLRETFRAVEPERLYLFAEAYTRLIDYGGISILTLDEDVARIDQLALQVR